MPITRRRYNPDNIKDHAEGPALPAAIKTIRLCLRELYDLVDSLSTGSTTTGGGSSSGGGSSATVADSRITVEWTGNGAYRVDTAVDGAWLVPHDCAIETIYLWRGTAGTSGQTVIDINRRRLNDAPGTETSLYTTTANRPTLAYDDADGVVPCNLPDLVDLLAGDVVTIDCDEKDSGTPRDFRLTLEAA